MCRSLFVDGLVALRIRPANYMVGGEPVSQLPRNRQVNVATPTEEGTGAILRLAYTPEMDRFPSAQGFFARACVPTGGHGPNLRRSTTVRKSGAHARWTVVPLSLRQVGT
ncbi:MAG: hypothetical protein JO334_02070 [Verrucomicrobia bacterium]|nr:hypothetical protein [Verrucomicrobiota bacterium]